MPGTAPEEDKVVSAWRLPAATASVMPQLRQRVSAANCVAVCRINRRSKTSEQRIQKCCRHQKVSLCSVIVLLVLSTLCSLFRTTVANPDAKRLYDDLMSSYNRLIRPVGNNSDRLTVKMGLKLSQLIDVVRTSYMFLLFPALTNDDHYPYG